MRDQIFLITTTDLASGRSFELQRMIASVARFRDAMPHYHVRMLLLFQNVAVQAPPEMPEWIEVDTCPNRISLSAARNTLLSRVDLSAAGERAIVAFPDDDAWYPDGALEALCGLITDDADMDLAFCDCGSSARSPAKSLTWREASLQDTISFATSNTIVLRAAIARHITGFDEKLGLGTAAGAGEDTDYAMQAWHLARRSAFVPEQLVGHRDNPPAIKQRYYAGSLQAIAKNRHLSKSASLAYARKILVGMAYVSLGRMNMTGYVRAVKAAPSAHS